MTFLLAAFFGVLAVITMARAWPETKKVQESRREVVGYDRKGRLIYKSGRRRVDYYA
jgi:hypothetical protein